MRTRLGVALVTVCLGLAGCSLFGKKQTAQNPHPKPFMGSESAAPKETVAVTPAAPGGPLPGANGMLAGQVIDHATGRPVDARIELKDLYDDKIATVDYETTPGGFFTISKLKPGRHYRLIARAKEGGELVSSAPCFATPPKATILLQVSKENTTPSTPPVPDPPEVPGKNGGKGKEGGAEGSPAANLGAPIKMAPGGESPSPTEGDPSPPPGSGAGAGANPGGGDISNVADGFHHAPPPPVVSVPPVRPSWPPPPPPPAWEGVPDDRRPAPPPILPATPAPAPSVHLPSLPTHIPSCLLVGNKLENFALKDLNGQTWEFRRQRQGRLVLLDFWYTSCGACKLAIPHLTDLQSKYGQYKLEVIGIACENTPERQAIVDVRGVRARYHLNYLTLLCGNGSPDRCPVVAQFRVGYYPTLVLLDESGKIVWRSSADGMDDYAWKTLEQIIANRLFQSR